MNFAVEALQRSRFLHSIHDYGMLKRAIGPITCPRSNSWTVASTYHRFCHASSNMPFKVIFTQELLIPDTAIRIFAHKCFHGVLLVSVYSSHVAMQVCLEIESCRTQPASVATTSPHFHVLPGRNQMLFPNIECLTETCLKLCSEK